MKKTNAMRILDAMDIKYEVREYDDDGEHPLPHGAASMTATKLGVDAKSVYKTIVMQADTKEVILFCQSADKEINLKKARNAAGVQSLSPVKPDALNALTGYVRGGCSPIGTRKRFRTFIDESILSKEIICVSAGMRGKQLLLAPQDLCRAADAKVCDLSL